jgi:hypothetical protein
MYDGMRVSGIKVLESLLSQTAIFTYGLVKQVNGNKKTFWQRGNYKIKMICGLCCRFSELVNPMKTRICLPQAGSVRFVCALPMCELNDTDGIL